MILSMLEQKVLGMVGDLQGDSGVHYSYVGDLVTDGVAVRILTSLELKGLVALDGGMARLSDLGASVLEMYR